MLNVTHKYALSSIDHMTHISNLENILKNGLLAHNNPYQKTDISNIDVNNRRNKLEPIHHHNLHDYVPFYFNPRNAMLYRTQKEHGDLIIILGFDPQLVLSEQSIYTDCNAACDNTHYFSSDEALADLQWDNIFSSSWYDDQGLKQMMMAETLVPEKVSIDNLQYIFCKSKRVKDFINENYELRDIQVIVSDQLFF